MLNLRPVDPKRDLETLDHLFDLVEEADGHRPIGEHKYLDLVQPDSGEPHGLVGELDGRVVAYVALGYSTEANTCAMEIALHPLHRRRAHLEQLVEAGLRWARREGAATVRMWSFQRHYVETLSRLGFRQERELRQLRRPLPPDEPAEFPDGIEV